MATSTRKCCYCKERKRLKDMEIHPAGAFCKEGNHALKYAEKNREKARQKQLAAQKRESRKAVKERNDSDKGHQEGLTQIECNRLAVMLDQGKPCISCNEPVKLEAGHFKSVASSTELRFNLLNLHGQCRACNQAGTRRMNRGKNPRVVAAEYEKNLRERLGNDVVDWLNGPHPIPHRTIEELKIMRAMYTAEQRYIKQYGKPSREWRRFPPLEAVA